MERAENVFIERVGDGINSSGSGMTNHFFTTEVSEVHGGKASVSFVSSSVAGGKKISSEVDARMIRKKYYE